MVKLTGPGSVRPAGLGENRVIEGASARSLFAKRQPPNCETPCGGKTPRVKHPKTSIANAAVWKFSLIHLHSPAHSTNSFTNGRDSNIYEAEKLSHLALIATHVLSPRSIFLPFTDLEADIAGGVVVTPIAHSIPESCTFFRLP